MTFFILWTIESGEDSAGAKLKKDSLTLLLKNAIFKRGGENMQRHFKVVIEEEIEGGFSVHFPALPGCATQGEDITEALSNAREALELYIWALKDDGLPIPGSDVQVVLKDIEITV